MTKYDISDLQKAGLSGDIVKNEVSNDVWKLITRRENKPNKWTFYRFIYTIGIADFILKNMNKRGDRIPAKHWEWRHIEDFKTKQEALKEFNK